MRNTLTSKLLAASAVGVFALGTVACGSDTDDPADPAEAPADGEIEEPADGEDPAMEDDGAMEDDDAMDDEG